MSTQLLLRTVLMILKLKIDAPTEGGVGSQVQKISRILTVNKTKPCRVLVQVRDCVTYNFGVDAMNNLKRSYLATYLHTFL